MLQKIIKRSFDIILALILTVILSPLIFVTSLLIFFKLGTPILFRQQRPGLNNKIFTVFKFRSMNNNKGSHGELLPDTMRLTMFGKFLRKFSLDELPQLWNVLSGDMSFVGPRPLLIEYLEIYNEAEAKRHNLKPGITGWAQINGRNSIGWEEKFQLDIWYVEHQSFALDIKILCLTILKVLKSNDINQAGCATAEKFTRNLNGRINN